MVLNIRCTGMDLTLALRQYVEEKVNGLEKFHNSILHAEVEIGRETHHHNKGDVFTCSAVMEIPGNVLKVERTAEDLYKAIDKVKDHLRELLVEEKERHRDIARSTEE